jgi:death-on-curing protein
VKYLTPQDVLILHARVIDEIGGLHGVRDTNLLSSAIERPKMRFGGKDLYKNVFEKAAAYFESLARNHAFLDGNKRTAVLATARFLFLNGYELTTTNKKLENITLRLSVGKVKLPRIAIWLKQHSP